MRESAEARVRCLTRLAIVSMVVGISAAYAQPNWTQLSPATSPDAREASWMTWDAGNRNVVMFGGCAASACPSNDTWSWDGMNWTQKTPAVSPPARFRHCMLYDTLHHQVVMFGGEGVSGFLNDTWVWDGTNWTQKSPSASPAVGDCYASFAYDEVHQQAILFTQVNTVSLSSETWSWDGNTWTRLHPATIPPFMVTAILVYDRARQQLVLATYSDNPTQNDNASTWTWSGSNWVRVAETGFLPFDQNPSEGVYDPVTQQTLVMLLDQRTYGWNGSGWFLLTPATTPPTRILPAMAFDESNQQVVLFGGTGTTSSLASDTWTYGFPTLDWSQLNPATSPPARGFVAMTFDGTNNNVVLFGGRTNGPVYLNDTWTWNGTTWTQASSAQNPAARNLPAMAYDAHNGNVVLFGGFGPIGPVSGFFADTWIWNGTSWMLRTPAHSPPAQAFHSMVYDSVRQLVALFSGDTCCSTGVVGDTWTWDGTDWTHQMPATTPPEVNAFSVAAFDATRGLALRFDTSFASPVWSPSTWTYDGTNWSALALVHTPSARIIDGTLAFDSQRQQITLFAGSDANSSAYNSDTWIWNGFDWTQINPVHNPSPRAGFGYAYDPLRNNTLLFGGFFNDASTSTYFGDTWTLSGAATPTPTTAVTITVPAGVQFSFNGVNYTGSQIINIAHGLYTLSTSATQSLGIGTQAVFTSWSDSGAITHTVSVAASTVNITGVFGIQYLLTTVASPAGDGTVAGAGFYNAGTVATVTAVGNTGFRFSNWSGACSGSGACSVPMTAPATVTANFAATSVQFTINVPAGIQFIFNGTTYTGTQTVTLGPGNYPLSTTTPQSTGAGIQAAFASWSDGGAIAHNVSLTLPAQSITGTFNTQYLLTTAAMPSMGGVVAPSGGGGPFFNAGTLVIVNESPNAGFTFEFWSGACSGSGGCVVSMMGPKSVAGNFGGPMQWIQLGPVNTPSARDHGAVAFDSARGETVIFGGTIDDALDCVSETWTWNGVNWTLKTPANSPSPRANVASAYDPVRNQTVIFGGFLPNATSLIAETWGWDGINWTQRFPANAPSSRSGARMAWDGSRLILFGGLGASGFPQDTWAWDGTTWTQLSPPVSPPGRYNPTMTYDPARNQIMMFGGAGAAGTLGDTWIWTGTNWVQQSPALSPEPRVDALAAYDALIQQTVLFSGFSSTGAANLPDEVWLWDGSKWKQQSQNPSPAPQFDGSMAYDEVRQQVVLFGGGNGTAAVELRNRGTWVYANNVVQQFVNLTATANPVGAGTFAVSAQGQTGPSYRTGSEISIAATPASSAAEFEFWTGACAGAPNPCPLRLIANTVVIGNFLAPSKWIQLGPANRPLQRDLAGAAFDTARGELVLFGGATADDNQAGIEILNNETWTWDGTNWTQQTPSTSPSGREGFAMAYDPLHQQTVIFGGVIETVSDPVFAIAETWTWDGTNWTQRSPLTSPAARFGARMAWDGSRIILFSGLTASGRPQETWAWDGANWTLLGPATSPAGRAYPAMVYDVQRNQLVMFGGVTSTGFVNDTWIWNGVNWTQQNPATPPEARSIAMAAYDTVIQKVVLFSGESSVTPPNANLPNEVWLWDGAQWQQESQNPSPAPEVGGAMAYDEVRQQVVLFGGGNGAAINHTRSRETWIYANNAVQQFVTLTVVANPAGGGAVTGSGTYRTGQTVAVTVTPAAGYEFAGWSGAGCSGNQSPCAPLLSGAGGATQTVTANFRLALSWLKLNPGVSAAPNQSLFFSNPASMTYDSVRNQIVYFGGSGGTQTWIWNGTTWALRTPVHSPPPRSGAALAFDQARQVVVLFGGANGAGVVMNDTWTWNGTDWTQMSTPVSPPVRANHSMAYDSLHQETVLFGGWNEDPVDGFVFRTDTWVWNGTAWVQRTPFFAPPGRSDFGMAYDPVNQQVVITTGFEGAGDTWTWDGTSWQFAAPLPDGSFRAMAYDQSTQRLVLVSEADGNIFKTSAWDGMEWIPLAPLQSPPARLGAGLAYDGARGEILLFGGNLASNGAALNDTWVLAPPAVILTPLSYSAVKNASGYLVTTVLANTGNANANTVFALNATLGSVTSSTITSTQFITIAPGTSANITAQFPASAGPGAKAFSIGGGFSVDGSAGSWSAAVRSVTLP